MPLQSSLFRSDRLLEAAAVSDSAHIVPGARGPHVAKIQNALNLLDELELNTDGIYGSETSTAVLSFKRKRSIVNPRYQTQADNIVGIMTMKALDDELLALEASQTTFVPAFLWRSIKGPRSGAS